MKDGAVCYLELPATDLPEVKRFYAEAFGWGFTDWGPTYAAFSEGLDGGFQADAAERRPAPLPVLWADDLEALERRVRDAGGEVVVPIFSFPGGRRFHFRDPSGVELAVMTDKDGA